MYPDPINLNLPHSQRSGTSTARAYFDTDRPWAAIKEVTSLLNRIFNYLLREWTRLTAILAATAALLGSLIPFAAPYREHFLGLALVAAIMMIAEVRKLAMEARDQGRAGEAVFSSLRQARETIVQEITDRSTKAQGTKVRILGGRIRSISEILREVHERLNALPNGRTINLEIEVLTLDPDFLPEMVIPGGYSADEQRRRGEAIAAGIRASRSELETLFASIGTSGGSLKLDFKHYKEVPTFYGFIFDDDALLWGGYEWDERTSDVSGPSSPCYFHTAESPAFESLLRWVGSKMDLLSVYSEDAKLIEDKTATVSASADGAPEPVEPTKYG